jgi:hypothetical protein
VVVAIFWLIVCLPCLRINRGGSVILLFIFRRLYLDFWEKYFFQPNCWWRQIALCLSMSWIILFFKYSSCFPSHFLRCFACYPIPFSGLCHVM